MKISFIGLCNWTSDGPQSSLILKPTILLLAPGPVPDFKAAAVFRGCSCNQFLPLLLPHIFIEEESHFNGIQWNDVITFC